jgi:ATP-binding cassette subfamily B protein
VDLNAQLPEAVRDSMRSRPGGLGEVKFALATDLTVERQYGRSYLIVTDGHVAVADGEQVTFSAPLDGIKEIRVDELFGSSCLVAELNPTSDASTGAGPNGDHAAEKRLVYYTKALVPEFGTLCRIINDLRQGRPPLVPVGEGEVHCPRCGLPLPERGANCPACVPRVAVFARLLGLLRPYKRRATVLVMLTFVSVSAQMAPPYITKRITDDVIWAKNAAPLPGWILAMLAAGFVFLIAQCVSGALSAWLAARLTADLRSNLHSHLQRLNISYFNRREAGEVVSRVMRDTGQLQNFLIDGLPFLLVNAISFVAIAAILLSLDWRLAMLVFLPVPFLIGGVKWFWSKLIPLFHKSGSRFAGLYSILGESIRGIKAIKAASDEQGRAGKFDKTNASLFRTVLHIELNWIGFQRVSFWIMSVGVTAVWFFAGRRIAGGDPDLTPGDVLAFVGYIWLFYGPLQWFSVVLNWMSNAFAGAERIFAVLDTEPEVYDAPDAVHLPRMRGAIRFDDVHFSYERGKEVIKGIDLDIAPGEMIGLVGKSGAGKSTIISLICRFFDVDSGTLSVDGHPIQDIRLADLRSQIGIVMQEPFLFRETVLENIRYGSPDVSFEDVVAAARAANAHGFICDMERGYDTIIGDGAARLSGGEQQRIAIARAILHNPPILIFDEATSSVDSETEAAIQEAINRLVRNRTTIAIAHRLATLKNADRLVVIDEGKIVETGTHDELLASDGIYARLVRTQTELNKMKGTVLDD